MPPVPAPLPEGWARESLHPIEWRIPTDLGVVDDTVLIEVSYDDAATWQLLDEVPIVEEYYRWVIPTNTATHGRVRVVFRRLTSTGAETVLRRVESPDVKFIPSQKRAYTWQKVATNAPFGPRDGAGAITFNGKMWLIGGWNGDRFPLVCANDVWSSSDGATWVQERPNSFLDVTTFNYASDWEGRHYSGYHTFDGKMWIVGGDPVQGHYQTDVWSSSDGRTWARKDIFTTIPRRVLVTNPASPFFGQYQIDNTARPAEVAQFGLRTLAITGVFNNKLFLMGGQRIEQLVNPDWPGAPAKSFDDIWSSTDGATWTQLATTGPRWSPRGLVSQTVEHQGRMWLIGGGLYDDPEAGRPEREFNNDTWSTADGATWEKVADKAPFSPRIWHNVKVFDGRLWVINGYDGYIPGQGRTADNLGDVWYSVDGRNWYDGSPPPAFVPRHAGSTWVHNGSIFVGSGNAMEGATWHADVWKMTPVP